jgi:hypothetical protein
MGNGFSRMLQMINVDQKKAADQGEGSDEELRRSHSNYRKHELVLPQLKNANHAHLNNKSLNLNNSADNIQTEGNNFDDAGKDENGPKM